MDLLKKASPDDDGIIDLTDIIEQGHEAVSAKVSAEQEMETQMDTLFSKGNKEAQQLLPNDMDADIDALLADMESGATPTMADSVEPSPAPYGGKMSPPVLNPDETLDMPNMTEVDALLEGLDIPPQPKEHKAAPPSEAISDDIDSLLGDLLDGSNSSAAKAAPAPQNAIDPNLPTDLPDDLPDDLDALLAGTTAKINANSAPAAKAKAAPAKSTGAAMLSDDIDALLAGAAAELDLPPAPPTPATSATGTASPKSAAELDLDDLDALFAPSNSVADTPAPPSPTEQDAAPKDELSFDDALQSLLDEAAAPSPAGKAGSRAAATPSLEDDIDALFAAVSPKPASEAIDAADLEQGDEVTPSFPDAEDEDTPIDLSDLDDSAISNPMDAEELADIVIPAKGAKAPPHPVDDLLAGLDLDDSKPESPAPVVAPVAASAASPAATPDEDTQRQALEEISTLMADANNTPDILNTPPPLDIAFVSPTDMTDMPDMPHSSPKDEEDLPELDALDALLHAASTPPPMVSPSPEAESLPDLELAMDSSTVDAADEATESEFTDEEIAQAAQALYDEKIMAEASTGDVDTNAWLNSLDAVLEEEAAADAGLLDTIVADSVSQGHAAADDSLLQEAEEPESIDQLLAHLPKELENTHYVYRPNAGDTAMGATPIDAPSVNPQAAAGANQHFESAYAQELARLQHITDRFAQSLAAADMHIAALTNTTSNAVPSMRVLDDMLRQDSPFSTALHTLVRSAVASELQSPTASVQNAELAKSADNADAPVAEGIHTLEQRLDGLATQMQNLQERISALEEGNKEARLQTVETRVDGQVKTIIHLEEQCKILEAHLEAQAKSQSNLENRFQHEVEKAAAAAAAKIIREEIAGILAGN